ncbi:MAG: LuxR C-terminal-related transcriptional regulator [Verrucomicrobiota bacterium]
MSAKLVIVSHQPLLRSLLGERLGALRVFDAVSEFSSLSGIKADSSEIRGATLLLVDADQPDFGAKTLLEHGFKHHPATKLVLLTDSRAGFIACRALQAGWHGILHKRDSWDNFMQGLRVILGGGLHVSPMVDQSQRTLIARALSDREIDVIEGIARGRPIKLLATQLRLTPATVRTHRRNCMRKINAHTQLELALYALRQGVLPLG